MIRYAHGALLTIYGEALGIKRKIRRFFGLRFIESDWSYRKRAMKKLDPLRSITRGIKIVRTSIGHPPPVLGTKPERF
jgi:hypothetical protein